MSNAQVEVKRNRVWIVNGTQSFMLAHEADTAEELEWYANQLRIALGIFTPCVKTDIPTIGPTEAPSDPMDTPLPCDVTVGNGIIRKGVAFCALVARMNALYEMRKNLITEGFDEGPTESQVMAAAGAISDITANKCGVDLEYFWIEHMEDHLKCARAALKAAWDAK